MSCIYNTTYALGCRDSSGGIQRVWIRNWSADTTYTYSSDGTITGATGSFSGQPFYEVQIRPESGAFAPGNGQHSIENGTNFFEQQLDLTLHKYQASLRNLIYSLALTEMEIIVLDQNNQYYLCGEQNGANLTASAANVGRLYGDLNGATITIIAKEPTPARQMSSTLFNTLNLISA
jgi:hypothetical protein